MRNSYAANIAMHIKTWPWQSIRLLPSTAQPIFRGSGLTLHSWINILEDWGCGVCLLLVRLPLLTRADCNWSGLCSTGPGDYSQTDSKTKGFINTGAEPADVNAAGEISFLENDAFPCFVGSDDEDAAPDCQKNKNMTAHWISPLNQNMSPATVGFLIKNWMCVCGKGFLKNKELHVGLWFCSVHRPKNTLLFFLNAVTPTVWPSDPP